MTFQPFLDHLHVRDSPHLEDAGQIDAGHRRADGRRTGRQHQLIVFLRRHFTRQRILQIDCLILRRNVNRLAVRAHIDGELRAKGLFRRYQQARLARDDAAHIVGQPAVCIRHIRPAFDHEDFRILIQSAQTRRARCTAGHTAHDDDFQIPVLTTISHARPPHEYGPAQGAVVYQIFLLQLTAPADRLRE